MILLLPLPFITFTRYPQRWFSMNSDLSAVSVHLTLQINIVYVALMK